MRILIYEHLCASDDHAAPSLRAEGKAMLGALLEDFRRVPGVHPVTLLAPSLDWDLSGITIHRPAAPRRLSLLRDLAGRCEFTFVIAPEWDDLLYTLSHEVEQAGGRLLGPPPSVIRLTADKVALGHHLQQNGVPTLPCRVVDSECVSPFPFPVVGKPRDGAGSQATFLLSTREEYGVWPERARAEGWHGTLMVQPFAPGVPASVAFLTASHQHVALLPTEQHLSNDGRFHYLGGQLPLRPDLAARAVDLARRAITTLGPVSGYLGVDLVLGEAKEGQADYVIEINPRLTTSYLGLRVLAVASLGEMMLRLAGGQAIPPLHWHPGRVVFTAEGDAIKCAE